MLTGVRPALRSAGVGDGRLPRRDGRHDEPGHANGKLASRHPTASRIFSDHRARDGDHPDRPSRVEIRVLSEPYVLQESFEELQQLFVDMFQDDLDPGFFSGLPPGRKGQSQSPPSTSQPSSSPPLRPPPGRTNVQAPSTRGGVDERGPSPAAMHSAAKRPRPGRAGLELDLDLDLGLSGFCFMVS